MLHSPSVCVLLFTPGVVLIIHCLFSLSSLLRARLEKDEFEEELKKLQMSMKKTPVLDDTDSPVTLAYKAFHKETGLRILEFLPHAEANTHSHTHTHSHSLCSLTNIPLHIHLIHPFWLLFFKNPQRRHDDIKQTRSELDRQRVESKKEEELRAFRAASEEKEARLSAEIDRLKDQSQRDRDELQKALESGRASCWERV